MAKSEIKKSDKIIADKLFTDISLLIERSRRVVALTVNREMTLLYWHIGETINNALLKNKRAEYGESIVATLSQQLTNAYGKGFTKSNLNRMINFYKTFRDEHKIATLSQELSWSHFVELIVIEDSLKRDFYLELCKRELWGVRTLRQRIDSMLYERTALSKKPEEVIRKELDLLKSEGSVTPDLDFEIPIF